MRNGIRISPWRAMLAAGLATAVSGFTPTVAGAAEKVRVGVLMTYSGPYATYADNVEKGMQLYLELHRERLGGLELEMIRRDDTGPNPDVAKRLAQELIVREEVDFLVGGTWTPNSTAVAELTAQAKVPYLILAGGPPTATKVSEYVAQPSFTAWQHNFALGQWAADSGIKEVYAAISDYSGGIDSSKAFAEGFEGGGGKIVEEIRIPLNTLDYAPFLQRIKDAKPEALYTMNTGGASAIAFAKAADALGLMDAGIKVIGSGEYVDDSELANIGEAALGFISAHHYSAAATRPQNVEFVKRWKEAYGAETQPNFYAVHGWDGMDAIFAIVTGQPDGVTADGTMQILREWENLESPRGPVKLDPETRLITQNEYIRRVEMVDGKLANVEFAEVPQVRIPPR